VGEPPVQSRRVWLLTALFALAMLLAAELALRSERLWNLPLELLLTHRFDTGTRAVQRVRAAGTDPDPVPGLRVRVPDRAGEPAVPPGTRTRKPGTVLLLGNSTAIAVMELPWYTPDGRFERPAIAGASEVLDLSVNASCYAEQLLLAQQAIDGGRTPELTVVFTWPYCLSNQQEQNLDAALRATRVPLTSSWLEHATPARSLADRIERAWVNHTAIGRYRHYLNAWLRARAESLARGHWTLRQPLAPTDRSQPFGRPWADDTLRYPRIAGPEADRLELDGPGRGRLELLVERLTSNGSRVVLIEGPWTPPIATQLAPLRERYRAELTALGARYAADYVDPNRELQLADSEFNDLLHVTHAGGQRYYARVQAVIEAQLRR
jgi:hypothetical protein